MAVPLSSRWRVAGFAAFTETPYPQVIVTTIVGLVPLTIGSPMYRPLCFAIIFGLFSATVISLFIIPALYLLMTPQDRKAAASLD